MKIKKKISKIDGGQARLDWQIVCDVSTRMGYPMHYDSPEEIFDEFAGLTDSYATLRHDNLGSSGKLWPKLTPNTDSPSSLNAKSMWIAPSSWD